MAELFNSPFTLLAILLVVFIALAAQRFFNLNRCPRCRKGKLITIKKDALEMVHEEGSQSVDAGGAGFDTRTYVKSRLRYRCPKCGAEMDTIENK
ncbi:hypothetical protein BTA51_23120 [Hahella sp. CCB-MM4]|uniref:hypothetical protein n=1 Tax=Hahella sp. (strain CCB-MM4) TaxID=1926491 RepID=UPI000B9C04AC|nr:hypothetical protein [Hahella sp. CCB-MM4]OZG70999.1 hypothetical protein BTA51_23120 [Hahella sp. CCB-MM4]